MKKSRSLSIFGVIAAVAMAVFLSLGATGTANAGWVCTKCYTSCNNGCPPTGSCGTCPSSCQVTCSSGQYLNGSSCSSCPSGSYCGGGTWIPNGGSQGATPCPSSHPGSSSGSSSINSCYKSCSSQSITNGTSSPQSSTVNYPNDCVYNSSGISCNSGCTPSGMSCVNATTSGSVACPSPWTTDYYAGYRTCDPGQCGNCSTSYSSCYCSYSCSDSVPNGFTNSTCTTAASASIRVRHIIPILRAVVPSRPVRRIVARDIIWPIPILALRVRDMTETRPSAVRPARPADAPATASPHVTYSVPISKIPDALETAATA